MTFQQFKSQELFVSPQPQLDISSASDMQQHHNNTTSIVSGGPSLIPAAVVLPALHNLFLQRAQKTKNLGKDIFDFHILFL